MIRNDMSVARSISLFGIAATLVFSLILQGCNNPPEPRQVDSDGKYLIINGDDLCMDEKTDQAILSAFRKGILTSTSAFINLENSVENLKRIHRENQDLPIGLHLNITLGSPVAPPQEVSHLTSRDGTFHGLDKILKYLPDMPVEEVRKELFAQAELFVSTGVPLDHIDCHHHITALYTPFFEIVRELAVKYDVPVRNPVPASIYKLITLEGNGGGGSAGMKKLILFGITHPFKSIPMMKKVGPEAFIQQENLLLAEGIKTSHWFIDSFYDNASVVNFKSILEQLPNGISEIMCHPGIEPELEVLTDPSLINVIDSLGITLITWSALN